MLDLLLASGADGREIGRYYTRKLNKRLYSGDTKAADALIREEKASIGSDLEFLLLYTFGSPEIRELFREQDSEIASGNVRAISLLQI